MKNTCRTTMHRKKKTDWSLTVQWNVARNLKRISNYKGGQPYIVMLLKSYYVTCYMWYSEVVTDNNTSKFLNKWQIILGLLDKQQKKWRIRDHGFLSYSNFFFFVWQKLKRIHSSSLCLTMILIVL